MNIFKTISVQKYMNKSGFKIPLINYNVTHQEQIIAFLLIYWQLFFTEMAIMTDRSSFSHMVR